MVSRYTVVRPRPASPGNGPAASAPDSSQIRTGTVHVDHAAPSPRRDARAEKRSVLLWSAAALLAAILHWRVEIYGFLLGLLHIADALASACAQAVIAAVFVAAFLRYFLTWFLAWLHVAFRIVAGFLLLFYAIVYGGSDKHGAPSQPAFAPTGIDGGARPNPYGRDGRRVVPANANGLQNE